MKNATVLSKAEMKSVLGGNFELDDEEDDESFAGTCAWHNGTAALCGLTKATARQFQRDMGGNWCCTTCPTLNCL